MTRIRFEWGMTAIIALPVAIGFSPIDDWGDTSITIHVGPLYFALTWRSEL